MVGREKANPFVFMIPNLLAGFLLAFFFTSLSPTFAHAQTIVPLEEPTIIRVSQKDPGTGVTRVVTTTTQTPLANQVVQCRFYDSSNHQVGEKSILSNTNGFATCVFEDAPITKIEATLMAANNPSVNFEFKPQDSPNIITQNIIDQITRRPTATSAGAAATVVGAIAVASVVIPAASNATVAGFLPSFWNLLGFSFLFARRKKRKTGRVIEEGNGLPIVGAVVELIAIKLGINGQPVGQKIIIKTKTDTYGEYLLAAAPGYYKLEVKKIPYFMSDNASRLRQEYEPNQILQVKNYAEGLIAPTIVMALSQTEVVKKTRAINFLRILERGFHFLSYVLMLLGTAIAANSIVYHASSINYIIGAIYVVLWGLIIYNSLRRRGNSPWGEVFDEQNRKALPLALVRVMAPDGRRLLRTVVSDEDGKFAATVDRPNYHLIVSKPGYVMKSSINVTRQNPRTKFINQRLSMRRGFLPANSTP